MNRNLSKNVSLLKEENKSSYREPSFLGRMFTAAATLHFMKKLFFLAAVFIMAACTEHRTQPSLPNPIDNVDSIVVNEVADTITETPDYQAETQATPQYTTPREYSPDDEIDNMRGFDPPSEDDMDDMGMDRYMENNDEEGWY